MLIVCPSCASEYMIDPGRLGAEGRTVRCANCKSTWFVSREEEPASASASDDALVDDDPPYDGGSSSAADDEALPGAGEERRAAWSHAAKPAGPEVPPKASPRLTAFAGSLAILAVLIAFGAAI